MEPLVLGVAVASGLATAFSAIRLIAKGGWYTENSRYADSDFIKSFKQAAILTVACGGICAASFDEDQVLRNQPSPPPTAIVQQAQTPHNG